MEWRLNGKFFLFNSFGLFVHLIYYPIGASTTLVSLYKVKTHFMVKQLHFGLACPKEIQLNPKILSYSI